MKTYCKNGLMAQIDYDNEFEEYQIEFFNADGEWIPDATYYTSSKEDAIKTARYYCGIPFTSVTTVFSS